MSEKTGKHAAEYLFFAIVAIQTIIAIVWLSGNMGYFKPDVLSYNYVEASKTLVVDDRMGILYALIAKLSFCLPLLYILQIICVLVSSVYACFSFGISPCFALYITTAPFLLQTCLEIRPAAIFAALAIGAAATVKQLFEKEKISFLIALALIFLAMGLIEPTFVTYGFFCFLIPTLLYYLRRKKHAMLLLLLILGAFGIGFLVRWLVSVPGAYGRAETSFGLLLMQRVVWPKIGEFIFFMPDNIETNVFVEAGVADRLPDAILTDLVPKIREIVGAQGAEDFFFGYTMDALRVSFKSILLRLFSQFSYWFFMPLSVLAIYVFNLKDTYVPKNIMSWLGETPVISTILLLIFVFALVFLGIYAVFSRIAGKERAEKSTVRICLISIFLLSLHSFFFRGPCFDASNASGIFALWSVMFAGAVFKRRKQ
ncbi:MAG: hypothetical protein K5796_02280 [Lachnospiraceae bacterium]|nr:hypothetical protein [Lachnospiraceae bacterium]